MALMDNDTTVAQEASQEGVQASTENKTSTKKNETKKSSSPATVESEYSAADLARAARARFGVPPEIVTAAMRVAGKEKATITEANDVVIKFMAREVK